jgi:formylglycine-generating enzyme required for sulfatase activity/serine/threonine protein kinase
MVSETMDDKPTMRPGGEGTLLAGRYRVVRQLGQGGMGSVWLVEDTLLDNKPFAVKMLPSILVSNKRAYAQLKAEALVAMKLVHPNIVTLRAYEENDGNPFLVMDYIDGVTLDDYLAEHGGYITQRRGEAEAQSGRARSPSAPSGGLPESDVLRILRPIAAALDYAHSKGVVHRDVKPGNVMIAKDGTPFILDFGIAREIQETMTHVTGKSSSGTLLYMSPEQLRGQPPKAAQDVYSFAAMVYECFKGEPPFPRGQIEYQILNEQPEPLNLTADGSCARGTLAASIMAGLAKKPEDRPPTCTAVLERDVLTRSRGDAESQSGRARSPSGPQSGGPRPVAAVKGILVAAVAIGLVAIGGWWWHAARESARIAAEQKAEVERKAREEAERIAVEQKAEAERKAREREEAERIAVEQKAEAERKAREEAERIAAAQKVEAERKAREEAERIAAAQKVEAERKAKEETKYPQQERQIQAEDARKRDAEFALLKTRISIKRADAESRMKSIGDFRSDAEGLERRINSADAQWKVISGISEPAGLEEAQTAFRAIDAAEGQIAIDLEWLKSNKAWRDSARNLRNDIAAIISGDAEKFKAERYAAQLYCDGNALRQKGNVAFEKGDFAEAERLLGEAKVKFGSAVEESKGFIIKTTLASAREYFKFEKWENCIAETDKVLGWDTSNAEALKLKADAESHLAPTARIVAVVNGREVEGAKINDGTKDHKMPIRWKLGAGKTYGPYKASYECDGNRYFGILPVFTVDWRGTRLMKVTLKEYKGTQHRGERTITLPGGATVEMIYCAPGTFMMGSPTTEKNHKDDETQHLVTLTKGFWLGKYEVTQGQWKSVMNDNPSVFKGDDHPVENVSWNDCQYFVRKVSSEVRRQLGGNARLPTEAEWEYACKVGFTGVYGSNGDLGDIGWYDGNSGSTTHPVGQKSANTWGFHDMHGNVCEWCQDWYGSYNGDATDPPGPVTGDYRVLRGGSWFLNAGYCRSAVRGKFFPGYCSSNSGFRLCCSAGPRE